MDQSKAADCWLKYASPSDLRPDVVIFCCNFSIYENYKGKTGIKINKN